jgi:hypothetical protein
MGFVFFFGCVVSAGDLFYVLLKVSVRDIDVCEYSQQTLQQQLPKNWLNEIPC